jgi:hypothetical protein
MGRTTKSNQHTRRRTPCSKQEASQVNGPSPAAKTEETHQMNGNMEEKIKKLAGDALMPEQVAQMVDLFNRTMDEMIQAQADSYRAFHNAVAGEVEEYRKCSRSFIIHNVDKWVAGDLDTSGFPLADRATAAIHKMTKNMVTVTETYTIRKEDNKAPTSVYVTLGSQQQKKPSGVAWLPTPGPPLGPRRKPTASACGTPSPRRRWRRQGSWYSGALSSARCQG